MCEIDLGYDETATLWNKNWPRAARWHDCKACLGRIGPGARYLRLSTLHEGSWKTSIACRDCAEVMKRFAEKHHFEPHPSSLTEYLYECVSEDSEEGEEWFVDLALMHVRFREARA